MAALAYALLPMTGLVAYMTGADARTRWHGLQAIALGLVWPVALYVAALGPAIAVRVVFFAGAVVWIGFLAATAFGRDPSLPAVGAFLRRLAGPTTRDARRSTSGS